MRIKNTVWQGKLSKYSSSKLYNCTPNPTSGTVNFNYLLKDNASNAKIELRSILGDKVAEYNIDVKSTHYSSELSNLPPAVYFYTLYVDQLPIDSKKLIISK